mgnify:CR=1 FL=1
MKNIFKITIIFFIIIFFYFTCRIYISEKNIVKIKKNRLNIEMNLLEKTANLTVLPNDTNNVIEFNSGFNLNKKKKEKRSFWKLIKIK